MADHSWSVVMTRYFHFQFLQLARTVKFYGYLQFRPCHTDFSSASQVLISAGNKELVFRHQATVSVPTSHPLPSLLPNLSSTSLLASKPLIHFPPCFRTSHPLPSLLPYLSSTSLLASVPLIYFPPCFRTSHLLPSLLPNLPSTSLLASVPLIHFPPCFQTSHLLPSLLPYLSSTSLLVQLHFLFPIHPSLTSLLAICLSISIPSLSLIFQVISTSVHVS